MKSSRWNNKRRKTLESIALEAGKVGLAAGVLAAKGAFKAAKIGYRLSTDYYRWTTATPRRSIHTLVGASLLLGAFSGYPETSYSSPHAEANAVEEVVEYKNWKGSLLFADSEANKVAMRKNITPGSYFIFEPQTLDGLTAFLDSELFPIFPPSVISQKDLIYRLSDKYALPPNIVATIMTIESGGNPKATSWVGARGNFQVMPHHYMAAFGSRYLDPDVYNSIEVNGELGMSFFANVCLPTARRELSSIYGPNHPSVFAKAYMFYNMGASWEDVGFEKIPDESKFGGEHVTRFLISAEIAKGLRDAGYSDRQIVEAMVSNDVDARAFALNHFKYDTKDTSYGNHNLASRLLSTPEIEAEDEMEMKAAGLLERYYGSFIANPARIIEGYPIHMFGVPLDPALRVWASAVGGAGLLDKVPSNLKQEKYLSIDSRRN